VVAKDRGTGSDWRSIREICTRPINFYLFQSSRLELHAWVNVKDSARKSNGEVVRIGRSFVCFLLLLPFYLSCSLHVRFFKAQRCGILSRVCLNVVAS
jgi:hypothetical protein